MEKVTVREVIEMLAKCNWDDEVRVITEAENKLHTQIIGDPITAISQSTQTGVQIVIRD